MSGNTPDDVTPKAPKSAKIATGHQAEPADPQMFLPHDRRFGIALIIAMMLWFPRMLDMLAGDLPVTWGCAYYLAALALARVGVGFFAGLVNSYRHGAGVAARGDDDPGV